MQAKPPLRAAAAFALGSLCLGDPLGAQIAVGDNVQVSTERPRDAHYEHLAAADPADPRRMLACSMVDDPAAGKIAVVVYRSLDGGRSWRQTLVSDAGRLVGDPVCAFGLGDAAYVVVLSSKDADAATLLYRSEDAGATWSEPLELPIIDREGLVVDRTDGKLRGRLYLHGTGSVRGLGDEHITAVTLFRSADGGRSFLGPVQRASFQPAYVIGMGNSVVLSDGTLVTLFGQVKDQELLRRETETATQPNAWLKVVTSSDGGATYSRASTVADWSMARQRAQGSHIPWLAADSSSSPFGDRLYAVWDDFANERLEVLLAHSDDQGTTWSKPVRVVTDDRVRTDPAQGPDQMMPVVAVNPGGVVGVAWYDRREHRDNLGWYLRFTASLDGGETFLPSVRVSSAPNDFGGGEPWPVQGGVTGGGTPRRGESAPPADPRLSVRVGVNPFFYDPGHTSGLAVGPDGTFQPVWSDNRTGVSQLWTAPVTVTGTVARNGSPELSELREVSADVTLQIGDLSYDRETQSGSLTAALRNTSKEAIHAPVVMRVIALDSDVGVPKIVNADNGVQGAGAIFDFAKLLDGGELGPGATSRPAVVRFRLSDPRELRHGARQRFGLVRLDARVLAKPAAK